MAEVYGYYVDKADERKQLCFVCATKRAITRKHVIIAFETDDYEYRQCEDCGNYIEDRVTI